MKQQRLSARLRFALHQKSVERQERAEQLQREDPGTRPSLKSREGPHNSGKAPTRGRQLRLAEPEPAALKASTGTDGACPVEDSGEQGEVPPVVAEGLVAQPDQAAAEVSGRPAGPEPVSPGDSAALDAGPDGAPLVDERRVQKQEPPTEELVA